MSMPPFHPMCQCMPILFFSSGDDDFIVLAPTPRLVCDWCGEQRTLNGLTIIGEVHGCCGLGYFRLQTTLLLNEH